MYQLAFYECDEQLCVAQHHDIPSKQVGGKLSPKQRLLGFLPVIPGTSFCSGGDVQHIVQSNSRRLTFFLGGVSNICCPSANYIFVCYLLILLTKSCPYEWINK